MILTLLMPLQALASSVLCLSQDTETVSHSMDHDIDHSCCQDKVSDTQCQCDYISVPSPVAIGHNAGLISQNLSPEHQLTYFHPSLNYQPEKPPQIS
jgi:hypothetical protein